MTTDQKNKTWYSVGIECDPKAECAADTAFGILDSSGTEVDTLGKTDSAPIVVKGYFEARPNPEDVSRAVQGALEIHGLPPSSVSSISIDEVQNTDWLKEWKKHWKASTIGRFVIAPPWEEIENPDEFVIRIEPQMAFGTGTHETTRLCLRFIDTLYRPDMSFLDVGTGTGILSIAASKMAGADVGASFEALDIDVDSVGIASENAVLNGVRGIKFSIGSISAETDRFDFVCANMTIDIIRPILSLLIQKTSGILILSGILVEQEDEIKSRLRELAAPEPTIMREGEWIALSLEF